MTAAAPPRPSLAVRQFQDGDQSAIARFNARLKAGGSPHVLYEEAKSAADADAMPRERLFVVTDGNEIRGGAFLREIPLCIGAESLRIGFVKYPVAESLIDKAFAGVPVALLVHLMRVQPNLAALGMGGHSGPFAQLLARLRWPGDIVTSFIAPYSAHTVARELPHLRERAKLRTVANVARATGAAAVLGALFRLAVRARCFAALRGVTVRRIEAFDEHEEATWADCRTRYRALTARDRNALAWRYPPQGQALVRLRVERQGVSIGWVALQVVDLRAQAASPYGRLALGIVCDALARPDEANAVTAAGMSYLLAQGADLVLANHSDARWQRSLRRFGCRAGPENFAFYRTAQLDKELAARGLDAGDVFITRGDDGLFAQ